MARIKYYYNTKTCNYERITVSKWDVLLDLLGYLTISLVLAIIITLAYHTYFDSPKEARLKQANEALKFHYELIQQELNKGNELLTHLQDRDNNLYRTILEAEPIPPTVLKAGVGGTNRYQSLPKEAIIANTTKKLDQLKRQLYIQSKSYDELTQLTKDKEKRLGAIPAIQPIYNKELKRIASTFGIRRHPIFGIMKMHAGVDFAAPRGTPIYATGDGVIKSIRKNHVGYGNCVDVNHGYSFVTRYAHMQKCIVAVGQQVKRGQCIGYVGSTGTSTAPHLHYEVIKNGKKVNPIYYFFNDLTAAEYDKLIKLASMQSQSMD
jgi:murein DD-endopeptidase MepM/ murein hydrolase activator NlpD